MGPEASRPGLKAYLDNAATAPPAAGVAAAVARALEGGYGNPSSRHRLGSQAALLVQESRRTVAGAMAGVDPGDLVFTGGGSEANNLAVKGAVWGYTGARAHVVVSAVEHPSVLEAASWLADQPGVELTRVPAGPDGGVRAEDVLDAVRDDTVVVSLMHVNNEIGTVQPVAQVGAGLAARRPGSGRRKGLPLLHVDAVQSFGRLPVDVDDWRADLVTVSAHKVHGPKGVGALYVRPGVRLVPLIHGGGHEGGRRSGTENVPGVAGFGAAVEAVVGLGPARTLERLWILRKRLLDALGGVAGDMIVNGPEDDAARQAPYILSLAFPGLPGEVLQHHLESAGVFVSTGSACSSLHRERPSHVLGAMGCPPEVARSTIRISFSPLTEPQEVDLAGEAISEAVRALRGRASR